MNEYKAKIIYKVKATHPDIKYISDPDNVQEYEDVYRFNKDYSKEDVIGYIKHDLSIIAGGGYDNKHINIIDFNIEQIG